LSFRKEDPMHIPRTTRFACLSLALSLVVALGAGCGDTASPDGGSGDGCAGAGVRLLSVVGDPTHTMYPGDQAELKVVFLEKCLGAVQGETITFEIVGNPGDSSLDLGTPVTEASGLAKVTLTAGQQVGSFQVWAHHPDDSTGVYFSIVLKQVVRQLVNVSELNREIYVGENLDLIVKVIDAGTQQPVRGVDVAFAIEATNGDASLSAAQVASNLSGLCTTTFRGGSQALQYRVRVEGASLQIGTVTFTVLVKQKTTCVTPADCPAGMVCEGGQCQPGGDIDCDTTDECPAGYSCVSGYCRPDGVLPESCETSADCPAGYFCENLTCYPCDEGNTLPECTNTGTGCTTDADCPPGFICQNGICIPDNPEGVTLPDLGGTWYTKHYFDIHNSLPGFAQTITDVISFLNQALNYCEITGIDFVDDLLCDLIDEYVPDWVGTLISILDNLGNMLSELRAEGEMELTHINPPELLSGSELWDKIIIRYLDACCEGQPAGCNPYNQPGFPDCAAIDIYRDDLEFADVGIQVLPFTAKINVTEGVINTYTLAVDPRQVKIEVSKFVAFLVDLMCQIFLGYDSLDEALIDIIDCYAIQGFVDDIWPFGGSAPDIVQACENFKPSAGELLRGLLDQIGIGWKFLNFSGWATIGVEGDDPPYGTTLGTRNYENEPRDGFWSGNFTILVQGDIAGGWFAER